MKLRILAQDRSLVVVHKPSGLVTYADKGAPPGAKEFLEKQLGKKVFPVHRIDKDTDGILVFALTDQVARDFTALFRSRVVKKQYLAVVHGITPRSGSITTPLEKHKEKGTEPAHTDFAQLASVEVEWDGEKRGYSLIRCEMKTGRYHQICRHLRSIGHPLCGDPIHGNGWDNRAFEERFGVKRTLLSAVAVSYPDRVKQQMVRLKSTPDADFMRVLSSFGWKLT
ncbi:MAG: RluA family pseudouridine synthase [Bdellovibrionota bacterium]